MFLKCGYGARLATIREILCVGFLWRELVMQALQVGELPYKGHSSVFSSRGSKESYVVLNHFSAGVELAMTVWASNIRFFRKWHCHHKMRGLPVGVPLGSRESPQRCTLKAHTRASFPTGAVFRAILPAYSNSVCRFFTGSDPTFIFKPLISSFRFVLGAQ